MVTKIWVKLLVEVQDGGKDAAGELFQRNKIELFVSADRVTIDQCPATVASIYDSQTKMLYC